MPNAERMLEAMIQRIPKVALFLFDQDMRYLMADGDAMRRRGWHGEMFLGRTMPEIFPEETAELLKPMYEAALGDVAQSFQYQQSGHRYLVDAIPMPPVEGESARGLLIIRDITAPEAPGADELAALRRELEHLRRAHAEQEAFLRTAAHDLHAPLRQIVEFARDLMEHNLAQLDEDGTESVQMIHDSAARMRALLRDLQHIAQAEGAEAEMTPVDLGELIAEILGDIPTGDATITAKPLPRIRGSRSLLRLLFQNLIENAIRYQSPARPLEVTVSAKWVEGDWHVTIADNGVGVAPEYHEDIFQPFKRAHGKGFVRGSGLGLATCARVMRRHGGTLTVDSAPDQGARFTARFPPQTLG